MVKPRQELLGNINNIDRDLSGTVTVNNADIQNSRSIIFTPRLSAPAVNSLWVETGVTTYLKYTDSTGSTITLGSGGGGSQTWAQTLALGASSSGYDPLISSGDFLFFQKPDLSTISVSVDGYGKLIINSNIEANDGYFNSIYLNEIKSIYSELNYLNINHDNIKLLTDLFEIQINNGPTWVWPVIDGSFGNSLTTDGYGNLSFSEIPITPLSITAPVNIDKSAASVGTDGYAARADHKHDISTATASSLSVGGSNSEGTSTSLARADHTHSLPSFGTIAGTFAQGNDSRFINPGTDGYILSTQSGLVTWSGRVNIGSTVSVIPTSSFDSKVVFDNYTVGSPRAWLIPYGTTPTTTNFCIDGNGSVSRLNGSVNSILSVSGSTVLFADATGVGLYKPLVFQANVIAPAIRQNVNPTGNGQPLEMYAQQSGDSAGGNLNLHSGLGSTIDGYINLYTGNNIRAAINTSIELYPTIGSNKIIINDGGTSGSVTQWMLPVATSASTGNWTIKSNGSTSYINGSSSSGLYVNDTLKLSASSTTIGVYNSSVAFDSVLSPISIFQYATAAGDGADFSISAQTSVIASGGDLILSSGSGTSYLTDGYWKARTGASDRISISPSEVSIYPLSGTNKIIIGDTSGAVTQWMLPDATSKTASNYAIISNGSNTYINGTTSVHFRLNNNSSAYISGSGFVFNTAQVSFSSDLPSPTITQFTKSSGIGETLVLQAQSSSDNTGGILRLRSGTGVTTNGALQLWTGATQRFEASDFVTINPTTAADSKAVFANYGAGTPALWLGALALTPTSSNYAITSSGSNTYINATATVSLRLNNSPTLFIDSSGVGLYKSVAFQSSVLSPSIGQNSIPTGVGQTLSISAQGSGDSAGGDFILSSGDGYDLQPDGTIRLRTGTNNRITISPTQIIFTTNYTAGDLLKNILTADGYSTDIRWTGDSIGEWKAVYSQVNNASNYYMLPAGTAASSTNYTISSGYRFNSGYNSSIEFATAGTVRGYFNSSAFISNVGSMQFANSITQPHFYHNTATATSGADLRITSQSTSFAGGVGGKLLLASGQGPGSSGTDGYGDVVISTGANELWAYQGSKRASFGGAWSTGNASPIKFWPGQRTYFASFEEVSTALNLYMAPDATTTTGTNYTIRSNASASVFNGTGSSSLGVNGSAVIQAQTGLATVVGNIEFSIAHTSPILTHTQRSVGIGEPLLIQAQSTQDSNFGGDLKLAGGMSLLGGDGYHGEVAIYHSTTEKARWYRDGKLKIADVIFPASRGGAGTMPRIADVSGNIEWITPSGTGDVVGPASSTNLAIPVFDGITGKAIKESVATIDASGYISGILNINKRRVAGVSSNISIDTSVGDYYYIGTLTGNITITLPASPSAGEQYIIKDSSGYLNTYSATIDGNGNNIDGQATQTMNIQYMAITLIYNGTSWDIV
jgi:hypothetical protein